MSTAGTHSVEELFDGIRSGNRMMLGKAITLVESNHPTKKQQAHALIEKCLPFSGTSIRLGITGVPGVGKSTFIEAFGTFLAEKGKKVGVLAIDPSSSISGGSILGDKTRMEKLSVHPNAFVRPSPSGGALGGVARATRKSIVLMEASGYDVVIVETVGVGQSETTVHSLVDCFLLLMLSGAGDELQGIKRGIMEMADILLINKADGDNVVKAKRAKQEYASALHLFPPAASGWIPQVETCSAITGQGIPEAWKMVEDHQKKLMEGDFLAKKRNKQSKYWFDETIVDLLKNDFYSNPAVLNQMKELSLLVEQGSISPFSAAEKLVDFYKKQ